MTCFQKRIPSEIVGLCFDTVDQHRYGEVNRNDFCKIIYSYTNVYIYIIIIIKLVKS